MAPLPMPPGIITRSMEAPDMAATQAKPDPVELLRKRYAAVCEVERAQPSKDAARATDAAAVALYRALREARA